MDRMQDFIQKQASQREAGLILTTDAVAAVGSLQSHHYVAVSTIAELVDTVGNGHKTVWHYHGGDFQLLYSFIAQYPGGMIELFEPQLGITYRAAQVAPGFVMIMTPELLAELQQQGYDVFSRVGLTLQL